MVKQDQNQSQQANQDRRQFSTTLQESHQKKTHENQQQEEGKNLSQKIYYKEFNDKEKSKSRYGFQDFDRNEGEGHSQKF